MGVMMQAFYWDCPAIEGIPFGWWAHLRAKVPELAAAGFTALWLPPANKAASNTSMAHRNRRGTIRMLRPRREQFRCAPAYSYTASCNLRM